MSDDSPRVLVVDDEEHLALGIAENLAAEGYETERLPSTGAKRAREASRADEWDLVCST